MTSAVVERTLAPGAGAASRGAVAALLGEAVIESGERDARLPGTLTGASSGASRILTAAAKRELVATLQATMAAAAPAGAPGHVPAVTRARAGAALGWIGDPRFDPENFWLPVATNAAPFAGFCAVPAGKFGMGTDPAIDADALRHEQPLHEVVVDQPFLMARWPVTVVQFAAYLQATRQTPKHLHCLRDPPHCPVRWVSGEDAEAYCRWLTEQLRPAGALAEWGARLEARLEAERRAPRESGLVVRLPREEEWEYAATAGAEGRRYPYGQTFDPELANGQETGVRTTSTVGSFGGGASRWGIEELLGNVWEWTASAWRDDYQPGTRAEPRYRVLRGGSFMREGVRATSRSRDMPAYRYVNYGFRVVLSSRAVDR